MRFISTKWGAWGGRIAALALAAGVMAATPANAKKVGTDPSLTGAITNTTGNTLRTAGTVLSTTSKLVNGSQGASVKSGKWLLEIPAGAIGGSATVTLSEVVGSDGAPTIELGISDPSLNNFSTPVWLSYKGTGQNSDRIFWWDPAGQVWREVPGQLVALLDALGYEVKAPLFHFSTYSVKGGRAGW